jgi:hypothetical protein
MWEHLFVIHMHASDLNAGAIGRDGEVIAQAFSIEP